MRTEEGLEKDQGLKTIRCTMSEDKASFSKRGSIEITAEATEEAVSQAIVHHPKGAPVEEILGMRKKEVKQGGATTVAANII